MSLLGPDLAQKFIEKTVKNLPYNINIMNDKGIIIASKDETRVGDFHEVAHGLLSGTMESGVVTEHDHYIGTKPGINMFIDYKDKHVGVICVTGDPESVQSFAGLVKTSMEAMLEYELQMINERRQRGKTEKFLHYVLFEDGFDLSEAGAMADELRINRNELKAFIIARFPAKIDNRTILKALASADHSVHQDVAIPGVNDDFIIMKSFSAGDEEGIREYKERVYQYVDNVAEQLPGTVQQQEITYYVGSLQRHMTKYRASYEHALQLSLQVRERGGVHFFNDYIQEYFRHYVTMKTYDEIFGVFSSMFSGEDRQVVAETIRKLARNNYNVVKASKELFVHRNTVMFRLNKIKDALNIDPISNAADREFLNELAHYLSKF
ncbi:MAG: CdaR family transcriptional regulator [Alkalispirochaeta sp.]